MKTAKESTRINERSTIGSSSASYTQTNTVATAGVLVVNRKDSGDSSTGSTRNAFPPSKKMTLYPTIRTLPSSNSTKKNSILKTTQSHQKQQKNKKYLCLPTLSFNRKASFSNDCNIQNNHKSEEKDNGNFLIPLPLEYGVSVGEEDWYFQQQQSQLQPQMEEDEEDEECFPVPPPGLHEQRSSHLFGMTLINDITTASNIDNKYQNLQPFLYSSTSQQFCGQQDSYDSGILTSPRPIRPDPPGTRSPIVFRPGELLVAKGDIGGDNSAANETRKDDEDILPPAAWGNRDDLLSEDNFVSPLSEASSSIHFDKTNLSDSPRISPPPQYHPVYRHYSVRYDSSRPSVSGMEPYNTIDFENKSCLEKLWYKLDPNNWLVWDLKQDLKQNKNHGCDNESYSINTYNAKRQEGRKEWAILRIARFLLYNPLEPEFTSVQQFSWSTILGITIGIYTAVWKLLIEYCVETMWKTLPEAMIHWGVFTNLNGSFPLPHYMWICPSICGGILSYVFARLSPSIPDQNDWIRTCHARGVIDHKSFWQLFALSTAGMASGLSLGPELPLVLTAGMIGSKLSVVTRQSVLSARAMNLTAASAAIAGFFGFPMAGALFVLELPHRMGLQYFEALSPATFASIVAVIVNRMVLQNDVTGYYDYPFLNTVLPAHIFYIAIFYGIVGSVVGVIYTVGVKQLKRGVHNWFHISCVGQYASEDDTVPQHDDRTPATDFEVDDELDDESEAHERKSLLVWKTDLTSPNKMKSKIFSSRWLVQKKCLFLRIHSEPVRAAVAGTIAGCLTGVTCMFIPHALFWGEAQLQTLIDNGKTPLPVFGRGDEVTADLTAYGFCLIRPNDKAAAAAAGFSPTCALVIAISKIFVVGLSLGTGIIGGHFWGPLFVAVAASYFVLGLCETLSGSYGIGEKLSAYPTVAVLCIMGSTHVVTFRAHMAIMLILTLTINAFAPEEKKGRILSTEEEPRMEGYTAGDYSAVFPLLVVSCFISLMATRGIVFYKAQRSRGDIMAMAEALCEPGKAGQPLVVGYDDSADIVYSELHSEQQDDGGVPADQGRVSDLLSLSTQDVEGDNSVSSVLSLSTQDVEGDNSVSLVNGEVKSSTLQDPFTDGIRGKGEPSDLLYPTSPPLPPPPPPLLLSLPSDQTFRSGQGDAYDNSNDGLVTNDDNYPTSPTTFTTLSTATGSPPHLPPSGHKKSPCHHRRISSVADYGSILSDTPGINSSSPSSDVATISIHKNINTTHKSTKNITHNRSKSGESMTSIGSAGSNCGGRAVSTTNTNNNSNNMTHNQSKSMTGIGMRSSADGVTRNRATSSESMASIGTMNSSTGNVGKYGEDGGGKRSRANSATSSTPSKSPTSTPSGLKRIHTYGEISDFQPCLFTQARLRSSSSTKVTGRRSSSSIGDGHGGTGSPTSASSLRDIMTRHKKSRSQNDMAMVDDDDGWTSDLDTYSMLSQSFPEGMSSKGGGTLSSKIQRGQRPRSSSFDTHGDVSKGCKWNGRPHHLL